MADSDTFQLFTSLRYDPALLAVPSLSLPRAGWNSTHSSPLYMLSYHRDRMLLAATHWGWDAAITTLQGNSGLATLADAILSATGSTPDVPRRVRVAITRAGALSVATGPAAPTPLANLFPPHLPPPSDETEESQSQDSPSKTPAWEVLLDSGRTARSEYTHFKTTVRAAYDGARQRRGIALPDQKEVLIVNEADGVVMEGSITTPYFWRGGRWVTPAVSKEFSREGGSGGQNGTSRRWALERGVAVEETVLAESLVDGEECWLSNGVRGFFFARVKLN
ncbi:aminotransferase [Staphylotrichum tortipilum]|uniref:Aminotransferase n=1 Tax=Staphylotrichum tortipilum TaxID=2831512 RepID=A0AAN6MKE0_9PEZI|nr:aminotransferase [Staphylotrichum longicolle]